MKARGTAHERDVLKSRSAFTNDMLAEDFFRSHTRGPYRIYPRTDGLYVVVDTRAPLARGTVGEPHATLKEAERALEEIASCLP